MTSISNKKVYIIAEIGVNHNGSLKRAKEMIKQSKLSGVDAVKFQTYKAENIADSKVSKAHYQKIDNKHESQYEMLKNLELSNKDVQTVITDAGVDKDSFKVELSEPLKEVGEHQVDVRILAGIKANLKVEIQPELQ